MESFKSWLNKIKLRSSSMSLPVEEQYAMPTVSGIGLKSGVVGKESVFHMESKNLKGEVKFTISSPNKTTITPEISKNGQRHDPEISKNGQRHDITYMPEVTGIHVIKITWNKKDLEGSPFNVMVTDPPILPMTMPNADRETVGRVDQPVGLPVDVSETFTPDRNNCNIDPQTLIEHCQKFLKQHVPWVLFSHGTLILMNDITYDPDQSLEDQAKDYLKTNGPVFPGTGFGDFTVRKKNDIPGGRWLVSYHCPGMLTYVNGSVIPNTVAKSDHDLFVGLYGRSKRAEDVKELLVIHIQKSTSTRAEIGTLSSEDGRKPSKKMKLMRL